MAESDPLSDAALVVRCGLPPFLAQPLHTRCDMHPDGVFGFSVQASSTLTVQELATACYNNSVGFTTVGEIRLMGYSVLRTSGEWQHATVVVPLQWSAEAAYQLACIFQTASNPAPKKRSIR
jgi:hypothetical protein